MTLSIGNAPCSWGVEFADDPRNPTWETVLNECAQAGYKGIELGPIGFMPEDPIQLKEALAQYDLTLIGGVVFRPFHNPDKWQNVLDGAIRTFKSLTAHGAKQLVLIDSIAEQRALTAGRPNDAIQMDTQQWKGFVKRIETIAKMGTEEYGLTVSIHSHAAGFCDFKPELERLLNDVNESVLQICVDTGHCTYAGFDPIEFIEKNIDRVSYIHLKDIDEHVKHHVITNQINFYDACAQGIFCPLGQGVVDFAALRDLLRQNNFNGWCTVEQDRDPESNISSLNDASMNRDYLSSLNFH